MNTPHTLPPSPAILAALNTCVETLEILLPYVPPTLGTPKLGQVAIDQARKALHTFYSAPAEEVTPGAVLELLKRWRYAILASDGDALDELMTPAHFALWWTIAHHSTYPFKSDAAYVCSVILLNLGLLPLSYRHLDPGLP